MERINNERFGIVDYVSAEADKITRGKLSHHDVGPTVSLFGCTTLFGMPILFE